MIGTSTPAASLSSSLLARKGQARPAMRPQGYVGLAPGIGPDDLGWNDMGDDASAGAAKPPVLRQREALDRELAAPAPPISPDALERVAREVRRTRTRAAFTLRLDSDRHLRLRLASAVANRSAQQIVTEALDAFLETQPDVDELVRRLGTRSGDE